MEKPTARAMGEPDLRRVPRTVEPSVDDELRHGSPQDGKKAFSAPVI
jgi:hypothetical protein